MKSEELLKKLKENGVRLNNSPNFKKAVTILCKEISNQEEAADTLVNMINEYEDLTAKLKNEIERRESEVREKEILFGSPENARKMLERAEMYYKMASAAEQRLMEFETPEARDRYRLSELYKKTCNKEVLPHWNEYATSTFTNNYGRILNGAKLNEEVMKCAALNT